MTMNSRTIAMVIDAEFDRPITPRLIRDLYWIFQAFTAAVTVIGLFWLLLAASNPTLFVVALGIAPVAWFIATMAMRMCLEIALVIFDLHSRATRAVSTPPQEWHPPIPPSFGTGNTTKGDPR